MDWTSIICAVLGSSLLTTVISDLLKARRDKKASKNGTDKALSDGVKYLLYDRIRHLGQVYIAEGWVDFDDRRILNEMHKTYHSGLGGNGDLDKLMEAVNALPLKVK